MTALAGLIFAAALAADLCAQTTPQPIRVLASNGVKAVLDELRPQFERTVSRPLEIEYGLAAVLTQRIEANEPFDVAILTVEAIDGLTQKGRIAGGTRASLARVGVGVGIRAGAPKPDISTPEAMKQMLLSATSLAYAPNGASTVYTTRMLERLGIAEEIKGKTMLQSSDVSSVSVAQGRTQLFITLISEIVSAPGVELLGPLPQDFQGYVGFAAGTSATSNDKDAAAALIRFLSGSAAVPVFRAKGMEPN
jgi:molybdate transport system substrate-binding protein